MRVFVTGATGFIGSALVPELLKAGHEVLGLARSDAGAKWLAEAGAEVQRGDLEDLDSLRRGAASAQAVIHLAFIHDFQKFRQNCEIDRRAIEAMGAVLAGQDHPLIVTSGLALASRGRLATEDDPSEPVSENFPRASEAAAAGLQGVRTMVVRLPQVHDRRKQGLITWLVQLAKEKGVSAYLGEGQTRWAAAHVSDVARLYRLAMEKGEAGARYHAVAEEEIPLRQIAEAIGQGLGLPVASVAPEDALAHFGWLTRFLTWDLTGSSAKTRKELGWDPVGPDLITDLASLRFS
jgi:nucleoside-diphosphate-sugar epimerase